MSHLAVAIVQAVTNHRNRFFDHSGDGMRIFLSVQDARLLDEEFQRRDDFHPVSRIQDGDTGTLWGLPFVADAKLQPGVSFLGYRVTA